MIDNCGKIRSTYSAYLCPGLQVFNGLCGQVLFVQLSVDLRQLRYPEPVTVLSQDLPDATLDLLRVVGLSFVQARVLIQIQGCWRIGGKTQKKEGLSFCMNAIVASFDFLDFGICDFFFTTKTLMS